MQSLKDVRQWLLWQIRNGAKVPVNQIGELSGSTRTTDYLSYAEARQAASQPFMQGLAFCFTEADDFVGIDLDDCIESWQGSLPVLAEWAREIVDRFSGTYAEVSPSLTGVKIYTRGQKPQAASQAACQSGRIEVYEHGRYFAVTEFALNQSDVTEQQEEIDWLYESHFSKPAETKKTVISQPGLSGGLQQRARDYAENAELPLEGGRNNAAFRLAGHLFAMEDEGEILSETEVADYVLSWNDRVRPPLPEAEVRKAVASAARNGTPRERKPPAAPVRVIEYPEIDISRIVEGAVGEGSASNGRPEPPAYDASFPMQLVHYPGLIGDICRYTLETSIYPQPQLALAGALCLVSVITGRKVQDSLRGTRTNLYTLSIGPTGSGKERPRQVNKELLHAAGMGSLVGPESFGSHAGIVTHIEAQPSLLFQNDEFGRHLATMQFAKNAHAYKIPTLLMQLYTSSGSIWIGDAYADAKKTKTVSQPHAVLHASSTPAELWNNLTPDNLTDGLLGRMCLFEAEYVDMVHSPVADPPQSLVDQIKWWGDWNPSGGNLESVVPHPRVVPWHDDAKRRWIEHNATIARRRVEEEEHVAAIWSRAGERTSKLALIFACSRKIGDIAEVSLLDVNSAIRLSNWIARRLLAGAEEWIAGSQNEKDMKKVLRILNRAGGELSGSVLCHRTRWMTRRQRDDIMTQLIEEGSVELVEVKTSGRPKYVYRILCA